MNKYSSRIKDIFNASPISKPNDFMQQKYFIILLNISMISIIQMQPSMLRLGYGAILGVFFVLIMNVVQNRNTK